MTNKVLWFIGLYRAQDFDKLILELNKHTNMDQNPYLLTMMGRAMLSSEKKAYTFEEIELCFTKAIEIDPLYLSAYDELFRFYDCLLDDQVKAVEYMNKLLRIMEDLRSSVMSYKEEYLS